MKKVIFFLNEIYRFINGDHAYQIYVKSYLNNHNNCQNHLLTKKKFLQNQQLQKYKKVSRCC